MVGHRPHTIQDKMLRDDSPSAINELVEVASISPVADSVGSPSTTLPSTAHSVSHVPPEAFIRPSGKSEVLTILKANSTLRQKWSSPSSKTAKTYPTQKTGQVVVSRVAGGGEKHMRAPRRTPSHGIARKGGGDQNASVSTLLNDLQASSGSRVAELVRLHRAAANLVFSRYMEHRDRRALSARLKIQLPASKRTGVAPREQCFHMNQTEQKNYKLPAILCVPAYVIIGFPKTGSTSLWNYMSQHPQVHVYYKKEAHYFHKPSSFVRDAVPWYAYLRGYQRVSPDDLRKGVILGDHTPGYIWRVPWNCKYQNTHHFGCANGRFPLNSTAVNIRTMIPGAKLVVLLRDPVDRAYSHFLHFEDPAHCDNRKRSPRCFHRKAGDLLAKMGDCRAYEAGGNAWDPICAWSPLGEDAWMQNDRALSLGLYVLFIRKWLEYFLPSQFCVLDLEHFSTDIQLGMKMIEQCLGIRAHGNYQKTAINRRATKSGVAPMLNDTRILLQAFYEPYNQALCKMELHPIGCGPGWLRGYGAA